MQIFLGEFIGTAILILLGNGVVANVVLNKTKGNSGGWIVITFGWAIAVFTGVFIASKASGAHLNPAVTLGFAYVKKIPWSVVPVYFAGQILGAMAGSILVWIAYRSHFNATEDANTKLAVFCTSPAIYSPINNLLCEIIATFVLVFGVLYIASPANSLGSLDALPVALLVLGIGLSLGGPTGYAINPARDFGPRIIASMLPLRITNINWKYGWIAIAGPMIGGLLAGVVYSAVKHFSI
ncbi:MAG: MIP/aquaporin family protein [Ginsengibacter sp.]